MEVLNPPEPARAEKIHVSTGDAARILGTYFWRKLSEQIPSVLPIVIYLFLFQWAVLRMPVVNAISIASSLALVIIGLAFFMEGLKLGLMPFGESIGHALPRKSPVPIILAFAFLLGIGATLAEPAISVLKSAGANVQPENAPLLFALLTRYAHLLVAAVGLGVGLAAVLGIARFMGNWSLKVFVVPLSLITLSLSLWAMSIPAVKTIVGLAWDCGGVTTGPVTVPLVLALGTGVCLALGKSNSGMSGFGIVTLASLLPIIAVLSLGLYLHYTGADLSVLATTAETASSGFFSKILSSTLGQAITGSAQAILPLCLFLFVVQSVFLKERIVDADVVALGISFALLGMIIFSIGLMQGLSPLGLQVGSLAPGAFSEIQAGTPPQPFGPLFGETWGIAVILVFSFFLGYGATLAEPALNAMGAQVQEITIGAFPKPLLMHTVAFGVGFGLTMGITKLIFNFDLLYFLGPAYLLLIPLTLLSTEEFVNIAWDGAAVTTGPITVPLVIALGLSVAGNVPGVIEGFGILASASVGPILSVLTVGLLVRKRA
jgi:hypothetical protein